MAVNRRRTNSVDFEQMLRDEDRARITQEFARPDGIIEYATQADLEAILRMSAALQPKPRAAADPDVIDLVSYNGVWMTPQDADAERRKSLAAPFNNRNWS